MESHKVMSALVVLLMVFGMRKNVLASHDTQHYVAVKNQQKFRMCSNATLPCKTIKMVRSPILCSGECRSEERCVGFNFRKKKRLCELFNHPKPTKFDVEEDCSYFEHDSGLKDYNTACKKSTKSNCSIPFTYEGRIYLQCVNFSMYNHTDEGWTCLTGSRDVVACDSDVRDCVAQYTFVNISIPTILLPTLVNSVSGWIFIHQKLDNTTNYNLTWVAYKDGFGSPSGNFWIGLERMHQMTSTTPYRLRVEVQSNCTSLWYSVEYDTFLIDSEDVGYAIHVTGYHGDAGDALQNNASVKTYQNGMKFSTRDVDNDLAGSASCAMISGAGGWYNACGSSILTGSGKFHIWHGVPDRVVLASRMMIQTY